MDQEKDKEITEGNAMVSRILRINIRNERISNKTVY